MDEDDLSAEAMRKGQIRWFVSIILRYEYFIMAI